MRGLSPQFMADLQDGALRGFLDAVRNDDTLCLEIRDDAVNIYYRGGNLCSIARKNSVYNKLFHTNYAANARDRAFLGGMSGWDCAAWVEHIPALKRIMDASGQLHEEREFQQLLARENNRSAICSDTDYYIADLEYEQPQRGGKREGKQARLDMVAVRWPSAGPARKRRKNLRLALIEVKYGDGALRGNAGIVAHVKDWHRLLTDAGKWNALRDDTLCVFNQKVRLGLLRKVPGEIASVSDEPAQLILVAGNHKPASKQLHLALREVQELEEYAALRALGCEVMIAQSSPMGCGLYEACLLPFEQILGKSR